MKKGDLFIYNYSKEEIYYVMYINDRKYYYTNNDGQVNLAEFFTNLDKSKLEFIKNFNIDNIITDKVINILLSAKQMIRDDKINDLLR